MGRVAHTAAFAPRVGNRVFISPQTESGSRARCARAAALDARAMARERAELSDARAATLAEALLPPQMDEIAPALPGSSPLGLMLVAFVAGCSGGGTTATS